MGASYMTRISTPVVVLGVAFGVAVTAAFSPVFWPLALGAAALSTVAVATLAYRKIGGINGDVLGAIAVVSGLAILVISGAS